MQGLSVAMIMEKLQIDEEVCRKNIQSLSFNKAKILAIESAGAKDVDD